MIKVIDSFTGEYEWLSNFYHAPVEYDGYVWPSAEHAYQAAKTFSAHEKEMVLAKAYAGGAKKLGRRLTLRPDWEQVKVGVMRDILREKFRNAALHEKLLATGDAKLVEGNWWGDTFWGVCRGNGKNYLGKLLMEIREGLSRE